MLHKTIARAAEMDISSGAHHPGFDSGDRS